MDGRIAHSRAPHTPGRVYDSRGLQGRLPFRYDSPFGQPLVGFSHGPALIPLEYSPLLPAVSAQGLHEAHQTSYSMSPFSGHAKGHLFGRPASIGPNCFPTGRVGLARLVAALLNLGVNVNFEKSQHTSF